MIITPDDVKRANEQSKAIAEASKQAVQPPPDNPDRLAKEWQSVQRQRSRQQ